MIEPVIIQIVRKKLKELHNEMAFHLATGVARDFADYKYQCGTMKGVDMAQAVIDEVLEEIDNAGR